MAKALTRTSLKKLTAQVASARASAKRHKEKVEEVVDSAVKTLETTAAGAALGAMYAKGMDTWFGVDASLAAAVGLHAAAVLVGGNAAPHLSTAGNAAAAVYGFQLGREVFGEGEGSVVDRLKGALRREESGATEGQGLSDKDLRDLG